MPVVCKEHKFDDGKFKLGVGLVQHCVVCGVKRTLRYRGEQPENKPGTKLRLSKKARRRLREPEVTDV